MPPAISINKDVVGKASATEAPLWYTLGRMDDGEKQDTGSR